MPVVVITVIGITTLFYAFENFQDRIAVTLACLIVEAGLYSQICVVIPISAAPKFVDIYFFYGILRMFFVCLNHLGVYRWLIAFKDRKAKDLAKINELALQSVVEPAGPAKGGVKSDIGGKEIESLRSTNEGPFFNTNIITPVYSTRENLTGGDVATKVCYTSTDKSFNKFPCNAWEDNEEAEKKYTAIYKRFTIKSYFFFVAGVVFDFVFFGLSGYVIMMLRNKVFIQYPACNSST
ncbi:uncharacterized protein LOC125177973 [Hyalella azteca]|uniref:Uncharacterized protein LOC125177973 n=1 Tax=Hyalella azteca TaxID=294128 RepID=A0A979FIA2_HYAAZ|nr:uncharacterized protein LOC125177973 [Hyalella azteca]